MLLLSPGTIPHVRIMWFSEIPAASKFSRAVKLADAIGDFGHFAIHPAVELAGWSLITLRFCRSCEFPRKSRSRKYWNSFGCPKCPSFSVQIAAMHWPYHGLNPQHSIRWALIDSNVVPVPMNNPSYDKRSSKRPRWNRRKWKMSLVERKNLPMQTVWLHNAPQRTAMETVHTSSSCRFVVQMSRWLHSWSVVIAVHDGERTDLISGRSLYFRQFIWWWE